MSEELSNNELLKIDQLDKTYIIRDKYYPLVKESLSKDDSKLLKHIAKYRDKNIDILSTTYMTRYPIFAKEDYDIVFNTIHANEKELTSEIIQFSEDNKVNIVNFKAVDAILVLMVKYYWETNQPKKADIIFYYIAYSFYWMIWQRIFFKGHFYPKEEVMSYVVNNMTNKFVLKQAGSVDALLYYAVSNVLLTYKKRVLRASDQDIYYIINYVRSRINSFVRKVGNEYFDAVKNHDMVFKSNELMDTDGTARTMSSVTLDAESLAQEYTTKFFSEHPRRDIIEKASKLKANGVSTSELYNTLTMLLDNQRINEVKTFYASLFYLFLSDKEVKNKEVKSLSFIAAMDMIYKRGNSTDKNIVIVKKMMDHWLKEGSNTYQISNREATLNNFRKAIYYYFILLASSNK